MTSTMPRLTSVALFTAVALASAPAHAALRMTTQGLQATADKNESGASALTRAVIEVQVTNDGAPDDDLGETVGDDTAPIVLPEGWSLQSFLVAPGGCPLEPIRFLHVDLDFGYYSISVVPLSENPSCRWRSGTYTYAVKYDDGDGGVSTALGQITIP